jgi:SAM-dependent methyltransferase
MPVPDDYRAESRRGWGARAEGWERHADAWRSATMPVSAWMIDALDPQPGQNLIELAAGTGDTGLLAAELVAPGGDVIISDFSPEMLAVARRRADALHVANVRFKQIDAETSIDVPAASLDGALCRWGYPLMADPENAMRETRRVVKPGARLALAAWAAPEENPWLTTPMRLLAERGVVSPPDPDAPGGFSAARPGLLAEQLVAAGFTEHHTERLDFAIPLASADDWFGALSDQSGRFADALARAADADVAALRAALAAAAERYPGPEGTLEIPAATWVAWAAA